MFEVEASPKSKGAEMVGASYLILRVLGVPFGLLPILVVRWTCSDSTSGAFFIILAFGSIIGIFARIGMESILLRLAAVCKTDDDKCTTVQTLIASVLCATLLAMPVACLAWGLLRLDVSVLAFCGLAVVCTLPPLAICFLQGTGCVGQAIVYGDYVQAITFSILTLIMEPLSAAGVVQIYSWAGALQIGLLAWGSMRKIWSWEGIRWGIPSLDVFRGSGALLIANCAAASGRWITPAIVCVLMGDVAASRFTPLAQAALVVRVPLRALNGLYPQEAARLANSNRRDAFVLITSRVAGATRAASLMIAIGLISLSGYLAVLDGPLLGGEDYWTLVILVFGQFAVVALGPVSYALIMARYFAMESRLSTASLVLCVLFVGAGALSGSILCGALGSALASFALTVMRARATSRHLGLRHDLRAVLIGAGTLLTCALLIGVAITAHGGQGWILILAAVVVVMVWAGLSLSSIRLILSRDILRLR